LLNIISAKQTIAAVPTATPSGFRSRAEIKFGNPLVIKQRLQPDLAQI
jgi:hypothetical protein